MYLKAKIQKIIYIYIKNRIIRAWLWITLSGKSTSK